MKIHYSYISKNGLRVTGTVGEDTLRIYDGVSDDPKIVKIRRPLTGVGMFRSILINILNEDNIPFPCITKTSA